MNPSSPAPIVFDTNALISAAILPKSVSRRALLHAIERFQLVHSEATWWEFSEVITRKKFDRYLSDQDRCDFMVLMARVSQFLNPSVSITDCLDPKDNKFLELAVASDARILVSGDDHLRTIHPYQGIAIVSPAEWLQHVTTS